MQCADISPIWLELAKGIPAGIVALVIAIGGWVIAHRQYLVARAKLNLDLFEKRYEVFELVWGYLSEPIRTGPPAPGSADAAAFTNMLPKAEFLFGKEVADYLREIHLKAVELYMLQERTRQNNDVVQVADVAAQLVLQQWFLAEASDGVRAKFGPFLDFEKWRSSHDGLLDGPRESNGGKAQRTATGQGLHREA